MGYRKETYKNGKLISVHDDRVFSEEQVKKKDEVNKELYEKLLKTDWYFTKIADPSALQKVDKDLLLERSMYRNKATEIKKLIESATELVVLDKIATNLD